MQFIDLLTPDRVVCGVHAASKKRALEAIAERLALLQEGLTQRDIMNALCAREKLGSTGLGHGVAIPHARMSAIAGPGALLMRLDQPVAFDAPDQAPVDLLFTILVPERATDEHLNLLAQVAELFSSSERRARIRAARDRQALFELVTDWHLEPHGV